MENLDNLEAILKRIEFQGLTDADKEALRQLAAEGERQTYQSGKFVVTIGEGKDIHIGDRIYNSWDNKALSALVRMIQLGDLDEAYLLVTQLNNTRQYNEEGDRRTGSFYTYEIWLEDVSIDDAQDLTEGERHIQKYTIKGKWYSKVYKEINAFGVRVDTPWGHKKKPNGKFTVKVEIINGRATLIKVQVDHYDDSANNYAAEKTEQLIQSKVREILRII